jgi:RNA polymerase sigma factor (sigma-70 family)
VRRLIGIGAAVTHRPLPHHRAYGSVHGGSSWLRFHLIDQRRKSQRFEVRVGKPNGEGFSPREIPGSKSTASGVTGQAWTNTQCQQSFQATAGGFPLPPQSRSKSQTDPASEGDQHFWRFADIAIDDALTTLATLEPRLSRVIELRFFGGLNLEETAEVLRVSVGTVRRDWSLARAWLSRELKSQMKS